MTYYGPKELASSFRTVRKNTIQIAEDIPEEKYGFQAAPGTRTVAQILTHLALTPRFQLELANRTSFEGFDPMKLFGDLSAEEAKPRTKAEVIALLRSGGEDFAR